MADDDDDDYEHDEQCDLAHTCATIAAHASLVGRKVA